MISALQSLKKSNHIYTNHSNSRRNTVVQTKSDGIWKEEVALLAVLIRECFPKEESVHIPL